MPLPRKSRGVLLTLSISLTAAVPVPTVADGLDVRETESPLQEQSAESSASSHAQGAEPSPAAQTKKETSALKSEQLQELLVTGSRIPLPAADSYQDVKIYTRDQIDDSGSTTVSEFLNTLPDASISINENGYQTLAGTTTVQLHGLPVGTTLVLLNGRRLSTSGAAQAYQLTYFDLNTIPLAAVDRVELVSQGLLGNHIR